jgi:glutamine amidotransferase
MITILDYGMGNLGAIANMLKKIGTQAIITSNSEDIMNAGKLILPGVGAFDNAMSNLKSRGLIDILNRKVLEEKTPLLGICLGMQLLSQKSEEGNLAGLGWIDAETKKFDFTHLPSEKTLKIPHMGWNTISIRQDSPLFDEMFPENRFYFVHSFHVVCQHPEDILTTTLYGYDFVSSVAKGNIWGVQFHPEKSHKFGMKVLKNFVEKIPC